MVTGAVAGATYPGCVQPYTPKPMNVRQRDAARTRGAILEAARGHFSLHGYDRATVRAIAADAQVSANLITRYFGGKDGLFEAATRIDLRLEELLVGSVDDLGQRMAQQIVTRWEGRPGDDPLLMMLRAAMNDPQAAARTATMFHEQATAPLAGFLAGPDAWERSAAASGFIKGSLIDRYVLGAPVVAAASPERFTAYLGSVLQQLLTGPGPASLS